MRIALQVLQGRNILIPEPSNSSKIVGKVRHKDLKYTPYIKIDSQWEFAA